MLQDTYDLEDAPSDVVVIGWDGHSNAILRFRDELHLPDHLRNSVGGRDR